jgi:hypothetical protein
LGKTTSNLYLWDYTVNFQTTISLLTYRPFLTIINSLKENKVTGIFAQGYADIPGDFTELRQYLLAKLLWDTTIDIQATTNDFLGAFTAKLRHISVSI